MNDFTPERGAKETQSQYKARRQSIKQAVQNMTLTGPFSWFGGKSQRSIDRERVSRLRAERKLPPHRRFADVLMDSWAKKRRESKSQA